MRYYEKNIERLKKTGVAEIGNNERIVKMTEKPQQPNSNWAIPPFYIYSKEDIEKIERGIREGCPTDAPGSFISGFDNSQRCISMKCLEIDLM